ELLALRAASTCRSDFEWVEHTEYARAAGLNDDEIAAVTRPVSDGNWTPAEEALLRATDELIAEHDVTDATWNDLARHYDLPTLTEIVFVVGQYTMLSMVANAAGLRG